jgi:hypothetical protein
MCVELAPAAPHTHLYPTPPTIKLHHSAWLRVTCTARWLTCPRSTRLVRCAHAASHAALMLRSVLVFKNSAAGPGHACLCSCAQRLLPAKQASTRQCSFRLGATIHSPPPTAP